LDLTSTALKFLNAGKVKGPPASEAVGGSLGLRGKLVLCVVAALALAIALGSLSMCIERATTPLSSSTEQEPETRWSGENETTGVYEPPERARYTGLEFEVVLLKPFVLWASAAVVFGLVGLLLLLVLYRMENSGGLEIGG